MHKNEHFQPMTGDYREKLIAQAYDTSLDVQFMEKLYRANFNRSMYNHMIVSHSNSKFQDEKQQKLLNGYK